MFQNVPIFLRLLSFFIGFLIMKHCNDQDSNIMSKGKRATKSFQVFLLLGIFLLHLNRHDLEKTKLGLGTQNFDLAALTQLAIFVKREENKVDCMDQCLTSDALSQPLVRHLIVDCFVQDYLTPVFGNHGWTKYQEKNRDLQY